MYIGKYVTIMDPEHVFPTNMLTIVIVPYWDYDLEEDGIPAFQVKNAYPGPVMRL